ncbi:M14 metallopeptidase family protein [Flavihumibacter petaseus]|uniref:Peptidase M14 family protein n=1 Tax=Flavihumibacter petaseus NBRC 106054 TaxID=1220578 RepID=A0A0E9MZ15_9BACT|nr:M14 metallopeptidase family protein [Flavihumibacter petaseus]GAO42957.1 peptidase M14 family protein [Flavihumibacter petaseus NBRC 106054]
MKRLIWTAGFMLSVLAMTAQLKSPEQFLGYLPGTRYTPHYKIVQYFQHVAQQLPAQVKVEQYGETNEGRPLLLATIASAENLSRIDAIRANNLRLANAAKDKAAADENAPVIVWLSYNVHGNETSSSEAAMMTLYELVNPSSRNSAEWLKNTVVLIDPCLNPDGRDRYVNWYTTMIGKNINPQPLAREHREPWPGGRSNHYNFDLNRDWAWQSQVESKARVKKYNEWLPQVHVDFHEQGFNEPYYFAPAAEPFHEVITQWQRDFQIQIGKNHAKYFDQNGWLYFTKERFDLFYPSYGDTYPIYSGSIGMTYEQGGIRAGLGIVNEDGDTVTLRERALHHFTTGISTVELSAKNAQKLVHEFRSYFQKVINTPAGDYKSWVIKSDGTDRVTRLTQLLDNNQVDWAWAQAGAGAGFNYFSGKQENFRIEAGDIVINLNQPKGNFVKVLFERDSKLSDSATYDITAWSIPFVYGLNAYGLKTFNTATTKTAPAASAAPAVIANAYAYAVKWDGLNSAKFLSAVLQKGIKVRYAEQPFSIGTENFEKGTLLLTRAANGGKPLENAVTEAGKQTGTVVYPVASGFVDKGFDFGSDRVRIINAPKVALLTGDNISSLGAGEIWHFFDQQLGYPVTLLSAKDFLGEGMNQYDVLILADGYYDFFSKKDNNDDLKNWVRRGGKIIALESAVSQMARADWGIRLKADDDDDDKKEDSKKVDYTLLKKYEDRERDYLSNSMPGSIFRVELDNSHPLGFGYPKYYYTLKQDVNLYDYIKENGWNVGIVRKDNYVSGFTGSGIKNKLKDGWLLGVQDIGRGHVVYFADDPIFRSFWENGKLLFSNAVFLVGQ